MTTNFPCTSFRYRLAPEFPYPVPLEDTLKATKYFLNNTHLFNVDPRRVAIVGKILLCMFQCNKINALGKRFCKKYIQVTGFQLT